VSVDGDRAQDVGRSHARQGSPSLETLELLERYRAAMRAELVELLAEIGASPQLGAFDGRPPFEVRRDLWALAVKLARELESERAPAEPVRSGDAPASSRRPAPRLTVAARRSLGQ
jgi:hypothetical protein